jgi:hypothetical protein
MGVSMNNNLIKLGTLLNINHIVYFCFILFYLARKTETKNISNRRRLDFAVMTLVFLFLSAYNKRAHRVLSRLNSTSRRMEDISHFHSETCAFFLHIYMTLHIASQRDSLIRRVTSLFFMPKLVQGAAKKKQHLKSGRGSARAHKKGKTPEKSSLRAEALMAKEAPTEIFHKADAREIEGRFYARKLEKRCYNIMC